MYLALALSLWSAVPFAAGPCFRPVMAALDSATTEADTVALARRFLDHPPFNRDECGKLVAGYLLAMSSSEAEAEWTRRQDGRDLLNGGLRGNEDDPRLFLAMGVMYYRAGMRTDARRLLDRARTRAKHAEPPLTTHELATMHFVYGSISQDEWRRRRSWGDLASTARGQLTCPAMGDHRGFDWFFYLCGDTWDDVMDTWWRDWREHGRDTYNAMVDEFEASSRLEPAVHEPQMQLLGEYVYERDFDRAYDLVRQMLRATPDDPDALAAAGAVYHATGRDSVAKLTFDLAFEHMPLESRRVYEDITPLLTHRDSLRFTHADTTVQRRGRQAFWNSVDPLYLTPVNERRLEHYARVATVDVLFGIPSLKQHGWDTDAGQIWIRYGRPRSIYEFDDDAGGRDVYWVYDTHGLRFAFHRGPQSRRYRMDEMAEVNSGDLKSVQPERGAAFFADSALRLDHQIVRILGPDEKPQVLMYAPWPRAFTRDTKAGLTLLDADFNQVAQWRGTRPPGNALGAELDALQPGTFGLALELWDPAYRKLARVRDTVTVPSFAGLSMSDILLATSIQPRDAHPAARADMDITPVYGLTLPAALPMDLYWEIYGLTPDASGVRRYTIALDLRRGAGSLPVRVLRGLSRLFGGNGSTTVRYDGTSVSGRALEWLALDGPAQRGDYTVRITVTDNVTGLTTTTERSFRIQ